MPGRLNEMLGEYLRRFVRNNHPLWAVNSPNAGVANGRDELIKRASREASLPKDSSC